MSTAPEPGPTALAVENERLQSALRARLEEELALRRVATLVGRQHVPEAVLALVAEEVARHLQGSRSHQNAQRQGFDLLYTRAVLVRQLA